MKEAACKCPKCGSPFGIGTRRCCSHCIAWGTKHQPDTPENLKWIDRIERIET